MNIKQLGLLTGALLFANLYFESFSSFAQVPSTSSTTTHFSCGTDELHQQQLLNPAYQEKHNQLEQQIYNYLSNQNQAMLPFVADYELPVVVHLIHNNGPENISDATVEQGIADLNAAFENVGYYNPATGVNTQIAFCLAKKDPNGGATTGITRDVTPLTEMNKDTDDLTVKNINRWDPTTYINIWLVKRICSNSSGCGVVGYAYFPSSHGTDVDGIMMEADWFGSTPGRSSVITHEMGHYLGVYHTFQGGCGNNDCLQDGDRVCDTPPDQSTAPVPCNGTINSCTTDTDSGFATDQDDMFINYMDYGDPDCYSAFTQGQADRMSFFVTTTRASLLNSTACNDPCTSPINAGFTANGTTVPVGTIINFTNNSINATNYVWQIDGSDFSTATNPTYNFTVEGTYTITLIANNGDPNCTTSFEIEIEVVCPTIANFSSSNTIILVNQGINFTNASVNASSYQWFIDGVLQGNTINYSVDFPATGTYEVCLKAIGASCSPTKCQFIQVVDPMDAGDLNFYKFYKNPLNNYFNGILYDINQNAFYAVGQDSYASIDSMRPVLAKLDGCGDITWVKGYIQGTQLRSVIKSTDGNLMLHGRRRSSSNNDQQYISKVDYDGNLIWGKSYDRTGTLLFGEMIATVDDPAGESYLLKYLRSTGGMTFDMSILKIDGNGNILWAKDFYKDGDERVTDIVALPGGGFKMLGYASSLDGDFFVSTVNESGNILNTIRYTTTNTSYAGIISSQMLLLEDEGLVVSGILRVEPFTWEPILMRFDANGNLVWQHHYQSSENSAHTGMVIDKAGDLYTSGYSTVNGVASYRVFKFDLNGNFKWAKRVGDIALASFGSLSRITHTNTIPDRIVCINFDRESITTNNNEPWIAVLDTALTSCKTLPFDPVNTTFGLTMSSATFDSEDVSYIVTDESAEKNINHYEVTEICEIACAQEICDNGIDDDGNGLTDCEDDACPCAEICDNGIDDDGDGLIDCFDSDCCGALSCENNYYNPCPIDCEYNTPSTDLALELEWNSQSNWHSYNVPLVADIDQDGIPEVIGKQGPHGSGVGYNKDIQIIDGVTGDLKYTITTPYMRYSNSHITIGDVDLDGFGEMIINTSFGDNGFANRMRLICYEHDGTQKWISDTEYGYETHYEWSTPALTDFNEDGIPEVYIGNQIFNALTGALIVEGGTSMNEGRQITSLSSGISNFAPIAVDVLPDNFCTDCQGKELVAGDQVIAVNVVTGQMTVVVEIGNSSTPDGLVSIADMDKDGDLDAVVSARDGNMGIIYAWDLQTASQLGFGYEFLAQPSSCCQGTTAQTILGDFDNDGEPEIGFSSANEFRCLEFSATDDYTVKWLISSTDNSGQTGATLFDFQADGTNEVLYRDQSTLRILDGTTGNVITSLPCDSGTGTEYPIVVDVDADGESEILCSCNNQVRVYGSALGPWAPSRKIWNQQSYFNVNINDDLSIPRRQQIHAWVGDSIVMNTFLAQYSDPAFPVADAVVRVDSLYCEQLDIGIRVEICNLGDQVLSNETPISFYQGNPQTINAADFAEVALGTILPPDSCITRVFTIPGVFGEDIFVVINDDNSLPRPYNLANDFPVTEIPECDFTNNVDSFRIEFNALPLDLGPDVSVCANGVYQFNAGSGFFAYRWQDGSIDSSFTAFEAGKYWVEVEDFCGNIQSDTVVFSVDSTTIFDLGMDTIICAGDSIALSVSGFAQYDWYPKMGLSCDTCGTIFIKPVMDTQYVLVAGNGLGCFSVDSINITIIDPINTYDTLSICQGETVDVFGVPVNTPGDYFETYNSFLGCDSTHNITLMTTNDTIFTITMPMICEGDSIDVFGNFEFGSGVFVQVDQTQSCIRIDTVYLTVLDSIIVEVFDTICQGETIAIFGNPVTTVGDYAEMFARQNGCDSLHIVHLSLRDTIATFDTLTICENETTFIFGQETNVAGNYAQVFAGSNSCDSTAYVHLRVLDTIEIRNNIIACAGETVLVFGNPTTIAGEYAEQNLGFNGCDSTEIITLVVLDEIQIDFTTMPACGATSTGSIVANVSGGLAPYTYAWSIPGATGASLMDVDAGSYSLSITDDNGCMQTETVMVDATNGVAVAIALEPISCFGAADGVALISSLDSTLLYSLDGNNFTSLDRYDFLDAANYTLYVKDTNNCIFEELFTILEPTELLVSLPADFTLQLGDSVTLQAIPNTLDSVDYNWTPPISISCVDCPEPVVRPLNSIAYQVVITDENGCTATDDIFIQVDKERLVFIPNAFSPNGDGNNDFFLIYGGRGVEVVLEFQIFDRWGNVVFGAQNFQPNDFKKGWDGNFKGKPMNNGIFVYFAKLKFIDGTTVLYRGDITLVR
ncbi:MAG: M43 family zinc metalloprotease [Saprospiraceae bacterium]